jgi:hypothetical protein
VIGYTSQGSTYRKLLPLRKLVANSSPLDSLVGREKVGAPRVPLSPLPRIKNHMPTAIISSNARRFSEQLPADGWLHATRSGKQGGKPARPGRSVVSFAAWHLQPLLLLPQGSISKRFGVRAWGFRFVVWIVFGVQMNSGLGGVADDLPVFPAVHIC